MNRELSDRRQLIALIIIVGLIAMLPLILSLAKKRQRVRSGAAGSGEIAIALNPSTAQMQKNSSLNVNIELKNTSSFEKSINVAGADLIYDPNFFTVSKLACGSILSSAAKSEITADKFYLTCFKPGGTSAQILGSGETITLGQFELALNPNTQINSSTFIDFIRSNVPDTQTGTDLSDGGTRGEYAVISNSSCYRKSEGDANCDDAVDLVDFEVWRREFIGIIRTNRANFNPQIDNVVDLFDFEIWRRNYTGIPQPT